MKLMSRYAIVLALVSVFSLASAAEAVDITATTSLGIQVSRHHIQRGQKVTIHGHLKSHRHSCVNHEKIRLFAKRVGSAWRLVAHTRTGEFGGYRFVRRPKKTTRFKTKYPGKTTGVHPNQLICLGSVSVVRKVRVT